MFSTIRNYLHRHRRKFLISGAVVGGIYILTTYAQKKLREWQEKEAKKFFDMTRKKQHFESTERTCNQTILSLTKIVSESVLGLLNTEEIVQKLKDNPDNKLALWEQLKIMIFTRICALVYALCILQVTLRVQLNIIGGYLYRDSLQDESFIEGELQAKYLSLCHHFVSNGVEDLVQQIEQAVKKVVEPVSLKKKITLQEVEQIFWSIQTILCTDTGNGDPLKKMVHYLVGHTEISDVKLDTIVKETMDILESDEVTSVAMSSVSRSFSTIIDEVATLFVAKSVPITKNHLEVGEEHVVTNGALKLGMPATPFVDVNKAEIHFVKLLPVINELITNNTCRDNTNIPDLLTQQLTLNEKLKVLGANIYENYFPPTNVLRITPETREVIRNLKLCPISSLILQVYPF